MKGRHNAVHVNRNCQKVTSKPINNKIDVTSLIRITAFPIVTDFKTCNTNLRKHYSHSKTNQMHKCIKFIYFRMTLYVFRKVSPSIIRSSRLYIQQQAFVCPLASGYPLTSRQQYLFDKCLLLYVQS